MSMFLVNILSMPALIHQLETIIPDCIQTLQSHTILERSLDLLGTDQSMKIISNSMKGTQSLALLANLINLFHLEPIEMATVLGFPKFTVSAQLPQIDPLTVTDNLLDSHFSLLA